MDSNKRQALTKIALIIILVAILVITLIMKGISSEKKLNVQKLDNTNFNLNKKLVNETTIKFLSCYFKSQFEIPATELYTSNIPADLTSKNCSIEEPIITASFNESEQNYKLHINKKVVQNIKLNSINVIDDIWCCFRVVKRQEADDYNLSLSECIPLTDSFTVPESINSILTECYVYNNNNSYLIQNDGFAFMQTPSFLNKTQTKVTGNLKIRKPNVFVIGIDSLTRINLKKNMPKTFQYLFNNNWFEMAGYNRIADNSFYNLMAVLVGYNETFTNRFCKSSIKGGLDQCLFMWNRYKSNDYVTAYAEDETRISTFNYNMAGFKNPPTDYYLRPLLLAAEKNFKKEQYYCSKQRKGVHYVFDFCHDFYKRFKQHPKLGVFWTNSFNQSIFNSMSTFDQLILNYFHDFEVSGVLNDTIIFFLSNHRLYWGQLVECEENFLPFLYIWLPEWFRITYPNITLALAQNRYRLTSPYDLHMTLKHILQLSNTDYKMTSSVGCPKCASLFVPLPKERTCADAGVSERCCTCAQYNSADDVKLLKITSLIVYKMNSYLEAKNLSKICQPLILQQILSVERYQMESTSNFKQMYHIKFLLTPNDCIYETDVVYNEISKKINLKMSQIIKLNSQKEHTVCVSEKIAKNFCYCY